MTTKEKMHELVRSLNGMKISFNLHDLENAIAVAGEIENEIDGLERQVQDLQKAA